MQDGRLAAGARIQNEVELSASLGVGRQTVRRAMDSLVRRGLLVRRPGFGTHVLEAAPRQMWPSNLQGDFEHQIENLSTAVLVNELVAASDPVISALRLRPGERVLHLWRLRLQDREPLAILDDYLPGDLAAVGNENLADSSRPPRSDEPERGRE